LRAAAHISAIGAIIIPAVMTKGSDIIATAPATQVSGGGAAGAIFGFATSATPDRGGKEGTKRARGAIVGADAGGAAGRVSDR
jgi:hypothetical protein